jgi:hypothetical protein
VPELQGVDSHLDACREFFGRARLGGGVRWIASLERMSLPSPTETEDGAVGFVCPSCGHGGEAYMASTEREPPRLSSRPVGVSQDGTA